MRGAGRRARGFREGQKYTQIKTNARALDSIDPIEKPEQKSSDTPAPKRKGKNRNSGTKQTRLKGEETEVEGGPDVGKEAEVDGEPQLR